MSLLGQGAFVAWHGIAAGRAVDYDRWHTHERMLERVGIPGFLRGRRCVAVDDGPRYVVLYEVAHIDVLTSSAYLERLDNPTAWTREVMPAVCGMNRTLCRVEESFGRGVGPAVLTVRLSPVPDRAEELAGWLRAELEGCCRLPGISGAHLLRADVAASLAPTREKSLRTQPDAVADWVLLVEGYDRIAVRALQRGVFSPQMLEGHDARPDSVGELYDLAYLVTREDVPSD